MANGELVSLLYSLWYFFGGGIGGIAGMYTFRHKTKKPRFVIGFPAILIFEIFVVIYYGFIL